ncbi:MAG: HAD family hydrolase [Lachnospiraceae bacterium]|nr:HAD family hydrolase [Lachnospiraceae bacterium]
MKGIACFDMDMTLLNHADFKIPESATRAIKRLRDRYYIVIATGRDMDSKFSEGLTELVNPDAIIHLNGTKITVGDTLIYEHLMKKELVERLLHFSEGKEFAVGITTGTEDYYMNPEFVRVHDMRRWGQSDRNFKDPWKLLAMDVRTMTYIGREDGTELLENAFPELKFPLFSSREGADIIELEASKAEGLKRLCQYYDIPISHTVAFGDSMNDYEILKLAGIGVAMGNGIEQIKQVADYVTTAIDQDGVWNACEALRLF